MSIIVKNGDFTNNINSTLKGNSAVDIEADSYVQNTDGSTIDTDSLTIETGSFNNLGSPSNPEGNVITDSFALSVAGDFNYEDDFFQNGNISGVSSQYFTARNGNFINPNNVNIRRSQAINLCNNISQLVRYCQVLQYQHRE